MSTLKIEDGSVWPDPRAVAEMGWALRYSHAPPDLMALASVCSAYYALASDPTMGRKLPWIRRAMELEPALGALP